MNKALNNKGEAYPFICALIVAIMMIFSVILTYASIITKVNVMKSNTEIVFDSFVANNSIRIYANIKQGNNAMNGIDADGFNSAIKDFCTFAESGNKYYHYDAEGKEQFSITKPVITYIEDKTLELKVSYTMYVPLYFAGTKVTTAHIPVVISSALNDKK